MQCVVFCAFWGVHSSRSLLPLEDVGEHGPGRGQLTHLAQELGLGVFPHQAGGDGHRAGGTQGTRFRRNEEPNVRFLMPIKLLTVFVLEKNEDGLS